MTPAVRERVFEPFFSTKPTSEGTGLGLATVYGIAADAGGDIRIDSEPGVGTSVRVHLPADRRGAVAGRRLATRASGAGGHGETVLLVDDEESMRALIERILTSGLHRRGGRQGIGRPRGLRARRPADRPDDDRRRHARDAGAELVERATAIRSGLRVLYMSGYVDQAGGHVGTSPDDFGFVEKPFTAGRLLARVREALDGALARWDAAERVLVIDDDESVRTPHRPAGPQRGARVETAADAAEARLRLAREDFALVICDLHMPGESGHELVRWIRGKYPESRC